jgi:NRPS condensation-like uncharacterized protein
LLGGMFMKEFPECFPFVAQDCFNYLAGKYGANSKISCILRLNGRINEAMLNLAVRRSLDVESILGCRLIEDDNVPFWEKRKDLNELELCSVIETKEVEAELNKFIGEVYDFTCDCQIKVKVFRAESDTICIKLNHACSDVGGAKRYVDLLVSIYDHLFHHRQYVAESRSLDNRDQEPIFRLPAIATMINNLVKDEGAPSHTVAIPCNTGENKKQTVVLGKLNSEYLDVVRSYARKKGATINDVLLTAYNRALSNVAEIQNKTISVCLTLDLRKYLPDRIAGPICNLSGMELITTQQNRNESFDETLSKVLIETRKMKNNYPGIRMALFIKMVTKSNFKDTNILFQQLREDDIKRGRSNPWFSNVGVITKKKIKFGLLDVVDCYMVGPAMFSPVFMMLASTYDNTLTLSANFFQSTMHKALVEQLIDTMLCDLRNLIGNGED